MSELKIPVVRVKGTPFECGVSYGSQVSKLINRNLEKYLERWELAWGATPADIMAKAKTFIPSIAKFDAGILDYMQGIATGSGLGLVEVIALNARYEMSFSNPMQTMMPEGCTAIAAMPDATRDGQTLLAQNWDMFPEYAGLRVLVEVAMQGKPAYATVCEAGVVCHRGMNVAGLGVCFNALVSSVDRVEPRPPFQVIMASMLQTDSIGLALKKVLNADTVVSGNILCVHRDGEAFDLETSPGKVVTIYPEKGIIGHTNHFLNRTGRDGQIDLLRQRFPDTLIRYHRSKRLLEKEHGDITVESFKNILKDHFNYPSSICRHADLRDSPLDRLATAASTIMNMTEGIFYITDGNPCTDEYVEYKPQILMG